MNGIHLEWHPVDEQLESLRVLLVELRRICECADQPRTLTAPLLFSIFATVAIWKINPRSWLSVYFEACARAGSKAPDGVAEFLPWNLSPKRLSELPAPMPVNTTTNSS